MLERCNISGNFFDLFCTPTRIQTIGYLIRTNGKGEQEFLLGHHKKQGKRNGFGGKVGDKPECKNESIEDALAREAHEELGIQLRSNSKRAEITFIFIDEEGREQVVLCHVYFVKEWDGEIRESTELLEPKWYRVEDVPWDVMWPNDRLWLEELLKRDDFLQAQYRFDPKKGLLASNTSVIWSKR